MSPRRYAKWWAILLVIFSAICLYFFASFVQALVAGKVHLYGDRVATVIWVNDTDESLQFYGLYDERGESVPYRGIIEGTVPARSETKRSPMIWGSTFQVRAVRLDGRKVFDRTYRWDELTEDNNRVVVTSLQPIE